MLSKEDCINRLRTSGVEWDYGLERDWCYSVVNWSDDRKNVWIVQSIMNRKQKSKNVKNEEVEETWGDEYDYI